MNFKSTFGDERRYETRLPHERPPDAARARRPLSWRLSLLIAIAVGLVALGAWEAFGQDVAGTPCGPVVFKFTDAPACASVGLTAPCDVKCGRLCWKPERKIWMWLIDGKGCPRLPMPSATPVLKPCPPPGCRMQGTGVCINPCPFQTPTPNPNPTRTMTLLPTPTPAGKTPCDRGEPNWCLTWVPQTDTVLCARCK